MRTESSASTDSGLAERLRNRGFRVELDKQQQVVGARLADRAFGMEDLALLIRCRHLQRLDLEGTRIGDRGLVTLSESALSDRLLELGLHDAKISDESLRHLLKFRRLVRLGLAGTSIGDRGLKQIRGMVLLESLALTNTRVTDRGLQHLSGMTRLNDLPVRGTRVTFGGVMNLFVARQKRGMRAAMQAMGLAAVSDHPIRRLDLGRTGVGDADLASLAGLKQLEHLVLANTGITDAGLVHVGRLKQLKGIYLAKCAITDKGLAHLAELRDIESMNLYGTGVTDAGLRHLHGMKKMKDLYLTDLKLSDKAIEALKAALPEVTVAGP